MAIRKKSLLIAIMVPLLTTTAVAQEGQDLITIVAEEQEFEVPREAAITHLETISALFPTGSLESRENKITVRQISATTMIDVTIFLESAHRHVALKNRALLNATQINVTLAPENIMAFLQAASFLDIKLAKEFATRLLAVQLHSNALTLNQLRMQLRKAFDADTAYALLANVARYYTLHGSTPCHPCYMSHCSAPCPPCQYEKRECEVKYTLSSRS